MELNISEVNVYVWARDEHHRMEAAKGTNNKPLSQAERAEVIRLRKEVVEQKKDLKFLGIPAATSHPCHQARGISVGRRGVREVPSFTDGETGFGLDLWVI